MAACICSFALVFLSFCWPASNFVGCLGALVEMARGGVTWQSPCRTFNFSVDIYKECSISKKYESKKHTWAETQHVSALTLLVGGSEVSGLSEFVMPTLCDGVEVLLYELKIK